MSRAENHDQTGWSSSIWPFYSRPENYEDDPYVTITTTASTEALVQQSIPSPSPPRRMRKVCLQRLDANLNGTGELVSHTDATSMKLSWYIDRVRYPPTELLKTPQPEDIDALRNGVLQGIFEGALVIRPYGPFNPVDAAILLADRSTGEFFAYHTDHIEETPCKLTGKERIESQMWLVFLGGEDLPSYHFWQGPNDPDPAHGLYTDDEQMFVTEGLVRQSIDRLQGLSQYFGTDVTNEEKSFFAEETLTTVLDILEYSRLSMGWISGRQTHTTKRELINLMREVPINMVAQSLLQGILPRRPTNQLRL
ncbi:MAG: hypothetical protein M1821_004850 [Bathelium mastoideum]|nr:MAG: hypothetical protein M1821_004850 [Bathelium mastoideum]